MNIFTYLRHLVGGARVDTGDTNPLPVVAASSSSTTVVTSTEGTKNVALTTVPEALTAGSTLVVTFVVKAKTANTGSVRLGFAAGDGTQVITLVPSESYSVDAPSGKKFDLSLIYIDVDVAGEGVNYNGFN